MNDGELSLGCSICNDPESKNSQEVSLGFSILIKESDDVPKRLEESWPIVELFKGHCCLHAVCVDGVSGIALNLRCSQSEFRQGIELLIQMKPLYPEKSHVMRMWMYVLSLFAFEGRDSHSSSPPPL
jgi:hypothetical protein